MFGPDLVVLDPHENFNVLSLSGKRRRGEKGGREAVEIMTIIFNYCSW